MYKILWFACRVAKNVVVFSMSVLDPTRDVQKPNLHQNFGHPEFGQDPGRNFGQLLCTSTKSLDALDYDKKVAKKFWPPLSTTEKIWTFLTPCEEILDIPERWCENSGGILDILSTDEDRRWYFGHPLHRAMKTLDVPKTSRKHLIQILATPKIGWDFCMKFWSPLRQMKVLYIPEISWELLSLKFCSPLKSDATDSRSEILVISSTPSLAATETSHRNFGHSWKLLTMRKHFLVVPGNTWKTVVMRRNFGHP